MFSTKKNQWTAFFAFIAMIFISMKSSAAGANAQVVRVGDGMAKIIFQPTATADLVKIYNREGEAIGELNWAASFELSVSEKALRKATTRMGIDLNSLLQGIGTVQSADKLLVAAKLPVSLKDSSGRDLEVGTEVFFGLDRLAKEGAVAPVVAWGGKSMGPGGAANNFNDRLLQSGVKGAKQQAAASVSAQSLSSGPHGDGSFPLDEALDEMELLGEKFLSSPTCTLNSSQRLRTTSYYGRRPQTRATNGDLISKYHDGQDIAAPLGTPVVAAAAGCVTVKEMTFNERAGYGFSLVIQHGNGFSTQYGHMRNFSQAIREFAKSARAGDKYCFDRGEQIGNSGMTGRCTGPHLHFGMRKNGKSVNPRNYMMAQSDAQLSQTCRELAVSNHALKRFSAEANAATAHGDSETSAVHSARAGSSGSSAVAN